MRQAPGPAASAVRVIARKSQRFDIANSSPVVLVRSEARGLR